MNETLVGEKHLNGIILEALLMDLRVCLLADEVSAPRSFPARSMSENFPKRDFLGPWRRMIWKTACDLEEDGRD